MTNTDAERTAQAIIAAFDAYRNRFRQLTARAPQLFEQADWRGIQALGAQRIDLYDEMAARCAETVCSVNEAAAAAQEWPAIKQAYCGLLQTRQDCELAETFYNSVYGRVTGRWVLDQANLFLYSERAGDSPYPPVTIYRRYSLACGVVMVLYQMLDEVGFGIPWENKRRDVRNIARRAIGGLPVDGDIARARVELIRTPFYRNKAAYLVGRVISDEGVRPFILPVLHTGAGSLYVDALITEPDDVSVIFSFTRSYFLVDIDTPSAFIRFLHGLIPMKSVSELYNSIGFYKQGKAELYREFMAHLEQGDDGFALAPGTKGMVMTVFTLPSYPVVFKVIRDRFATSKRLTRATVIEKYQLVKRHDRGGRMADTQEFRQLRLPMKRFPPDVLEALLGAAPSTIHVEGEELLIDHLWCERRMVPLNLYIDSALAQQDQLRLHQAINEYGNAIKQLAAANIFAGDMLFKNFGVTRHGRVVFYDYDEIQYLTDCNFRRIPEPLYPEQELSGEPWYSVGPLDVFPEEFSILTACDPQIRQLFDKLHGDLLDVGFWRSLQQEIRTGEVVDLFPYRADRRFDPQR